MKQRFSASVWREGAWYVAQCLEVDVASQGETEEAALANLKEALELYFEPPTPSVTPHIRSVEAEIGAAQTAPFP
ncbi:MAG: type II toxin-antitoxin system HicB family antitoxin [Ktedonobacterales bacterium]|jgi:predicted RNase H-like HicB family nuclease